MFKSILLFFLSMLAGSCLLAESFLLPPESLDSVIGELRYIKANQEDTLLDIARHYDFGYEEIIQANPEVDRWIPGQGTTILLPGKFILPDTPKKGIVLNLAELRLYYFPPLIRGVANRVYTYPISIGRMDWKSPLGVTRIVSKESNPAWYPPESIREEHAAEGEYLQTVIPGGDPTNPLGKYALKLALPSYLIHGTDERKEYGIGMRVTHGCIRMYPEDIEELYSLVTVNTPVTFVDQPIKIDWLGGELFLEVHVPLKENESEFEEYSHTVGIEDVEMLFEKKLTNKVRYDPNKIREVWESGNGIPVVIAQTESLLPPARR